MRLGNLYKQAVLAIMVGLLLQPNALLAQFGSSSDNQQGLGSSDDDLTDDHQTNGTGYTSGSGSAGSTTYTPGSSGDIIPNPPLTGDDPGVPIDGGLSVLLAAGAAYGVKRMRKPQKESDKL